MMAKLMVWAVTQWHDLPLFFAEIVTFTNYLNMLKCCIYPVTGNAAKPVFTTKWHATSNSQIWGMAMADLSFGPADHQTSHPKAHFMVTCKNYVTKLQRSTSTIQRLELVFPLNCWCWNIPMHTHISDYFKQGAYNKCCPYSMCLSHRET
jgi:hypothetical protein